VRAGAQAGGAEWPAFPLLLLLIVVLFNQQQPPKPHTTPAVQATFGTMFSVLIMVDFMFLDDSAFIYDPDVKVRCSVAAWRLAAAAAFMRTH